SEVADGDVVGGDVNAVTAGGGDDGGQPLAAADDADALGNVELLGQNVRPGRQQDGVAGGGGSHRLVERGEATGADQQEAPCPRTVDELDVGEGVASLVAGTHSPDIVDRVVDDVFGGQRCGVDGSVTLGLAAFAAIDDVVAGAAGERIV